MSEVDRLVDAGLRLHERAAAVQWRGPDPYDALWWHWPETLVGGRRRRQVITQLHARSPVDVRRVYRRTHPLLAKTLALFGSAGLRLAALTGGERAQAIAVDALDLLDADRRAGPYVWGYPFDVQTRWSFYPASEPSMVPTAFAVGALLEAERATGSAHFGDRARSAASWVLDSLWAEGGYFAYHPHSDANIHNANLLGAWLVWAALGDDDRARDRVLQAVERTIADQRPDGSWPYAEGGRNMGWADSFHTGYVLLCLDRLHDVDPAVDTAVARGAQFYLRFFGPLGEARLWPDRPYPEDGHSAGTGLSTLAALLRRGQVQRSLVSRAAQRVLDKGIDHDRAVFRRYRWGVRTAVRYLRWCDGHVALGLADAAAALAGSPDAAATATRT
jgi:hypothetical protein